MYDFGNSCLYVGGYTVCHRGDDMDLKPHLQLVCAKKQHLPSLFFAFIKHEKMIFCNLFFLILFGSRLDTTSFVSSLEEKDDNFFTN
jgi:hypothetical protein